MKVIRLFCPGIPRDIESNIFITLTKRTVFARRKVLKIGAVYFTLLWVLFTKKCFTRFLPEISQKLLETTLKFIFGFLRWDFAQIQIYFTRVS